MDNFFDREDKDDGEGWKNVNNSEEEIYNEYARQTQISIQRIRARNRADERIPLQGVLEMNINDYLAYLTILHHTFEIEEERLRQKKRIDVIAYLRDKFNAKTFGESQLVLKEKRVDPNIVKFWINENMLDISEVESAYHGYAELRESLDEYRSLIMSSGIRFLRKFDYDFDSLPAFDPSFYSRSDERDSKK